MQSMVLSAGIIVSTGSGESGIRQILRVLDSGASSTVGNWRWENTKGDGTVSYRVSGTQFKTV